MKFLVGEKLEFNQKSDPTNQIYPIGTEASVVEYGTGGMYRLKLSTGDTIDVSEPFLVRYFIRKMPHKSNLSSQ